MTAKEFEYWLVLTKLQRNILSVIQNLELPNRPVNPQIKRLKEAVKVSEKAMEKLTKK